MPKFKPTVYQQAVFDWIENGSGNLIIQAVAGSGKTTTIMQGLEKIPAGQDVVMLAFNRSIADELNKRIKRSKQKKGANMANVQAFTQNGIGYRVLKKWAESQNLLPMRKIGSKEYEKLIEEDMAPFGFIDDGINTDPMNEEIIDEYGTKWVPVVRKNH